MGIAIAKELHDKGAEVTLILGPSSLDFSANVIAVTRVNTADEMYQSSHAEFANADLMVMAAAVADYRAADQSDKKIKKTEKKLTIELDATKDILKSLGEVKKPGQVLVGFALETDN